MTDFSPFQVARGSAEDDLERLVASVRAAFRNPSVSKAAAGAVAALAVDAATAIRRRRDLATIERLKAEREAARALAASARRAGDTYDKAMAAARSGVFECRLSDGSLEWTSGVYDMFGFPAGAKLRREDVTGLYAPASLAALDRRRDHALATGGGFECEAEITSAKGERRWIRINAQAERRDGRAVRLFGMKQDVTEARLVAEEARRLAESDPLTGLAGRRAFERRLARMEDGALLLVDLDGFKQINDTYGHSVGDECLRIAAARLRAACRDAELVARVGGDEFAVVYGPSASVDAPTRAARAIIECFNEPAPAAGGALRLSASVGLARCAGLDPADLFARADAAAYAAKAAGRGTYRIHTSALPTKIVPIETAASPGYLAGAA